MNADRHRSGIIFIAILLLAFSASAQTIKIKDYYHIADGNEWRYTAPPGWKDGDYISRIERDPEITHWDKKDSPKRFFHFDATRAAKILSVDDKKGITYVSEVFANDDGSAVFDKPILWFPTKIKIGQSTEISTGFTRSFKDEKTGWGIYKLTQTATRFEEVTVPAGKFKKTLRIESESFWDLGDGRTAKTISVYHYAKKVGVVKASARFIIMKDGKETINRLVETDLKSYKLNK
jgi:hypothetical protein